MLGVEMALYQYQAENPGEKNNSSLIFLTHENKTCCCYSYTEMFFSC